MATSLRIEAIFDGKELAAGVDASKRQLKDLEAAIKSENASRREAARQAAQLRRDEDRAFAESIKAEIRQRREAARIAAALARDEEKEMRRLAAVREELQRRADTRIVRRTERELEQAREANTRQALLTDRNGPLIRRYRNAAGEGGAGLGEFGSIGAGLLSLTAAIEGVRRVAEDTAAAQNSRRFLENQARLSNVSAADQLREAALLRSSLGGGVSGGTAERLQGEGLRFASSVGRTDQARQFIRALSDAAAGAGQGTSERELSDLARQVFTGQDEAFDKLAGKNPEFFYQRAAAAAGKSVGDLNDAEKAQIRFNTVLELGQQNLGETARRLETTAGAYQRFASVLTDANVAVGKSVDGVFAQAINRAADLATEAQKQAESGPALNPLGGDIFIAAFNARSAEADRARATRRQQQEDFNRLAPTSRQVYSGDFFGLVSDYASQQAVDQEAAARAAAARAQAVRSAAGAKTATELGRLGRQENRVGAIENRYAASFDQIYDSYVDKKTGVFQPDAGYNVLVQGEAAKRDLEIGRERKKQAEELATATRTVNDSFNALSQNNAFLKWSTDGAEAIRRLREQFKGTDVDISGLIASQKRLDQLSLGKLLAGNVGQVSDLGARISELSTLRSTTNVVGQAAGLPQYRVSQAYRRETDLERVARVLKDADDVQRTVFEGLSGLSPDERARYARQLRADSIASGTAGLDPNAALTPQQRTTIVESLREQRSLLLQQRIDAIRENANAAKTASATEQTAINTKALVDHFLGKNGAPGKGTAGGDGSVQITVKDESNVVKDVTARNLTARRENLGPWGGYDVFQDY